jgi:hypothetical protein
MALTRPCYDYLEPGNQLDKFKLPVDENNKIASVHYLNYKYTESKEDVCKADRLAVSDFFEDGIYNPTLL